MSSSDSVKSSDVAQGGNRRVLSKSTRNRMRSCKRLSHSYYELDSSSNESGKDTKVKGVNLLKVGKKKHKVRSSKSRSSRGLERIRTPNKESILDQISNKRVLPEPLSPIGVKRKIFPLPSESDSVTSNDSNLPKNYEDSEHDKGNSVEEPNNSSINEDWQGPTELVQEENNAKEDPKNDTNMNVVFSRTEGVGNCDTTESPCVDTGLPKSEASFDKNKVVNKYDVLMRIEAMIGKDPHFLKELYEFTNRSPNFNQSTASTSEENKGPIDKSSVEGTRSDSNMCVIGFKTSDGSKGNIGSGSPSDELSGGNLKSCLESHTDQPQKIRLNIKKISGNRYTSVCKISEERNENLKCSSVKNCGATQDLNTIRNCSKPKENKSPLAFDNSERLLEGRQSVSTSGENPQEISKTEVNEHGKDDSGKAASYKGGNSLKKSGKARRKLIDFGNSLGDIPRVQSQNEIVHFSGSDKSNFDTRSVDRATNSKHGETKNVKKDEMKENIAETRFSTEDGLGECINEVKFTSATNSGDNQLAENTYDPLEYSFVTDLNFESTIYSPSKLALITVPPDSSEVNNDPVSETPWSGTPGPEDPTICLFDVDMINQFSPSLTTPDSVEVVEVTDDSIREVNSGNKEQESSPTGVEKSDQPGQPENADLVSFETGKITPDKISADSSSDIVELPSPENVDLLTSLLYRADFDKVLCAVEGMEKSNGDDGNDSLRAENPLINGSNPGEIQLTSCSGSNYVHEEKKSLKHDAKSLEKIECEKSETGNYSEEYRKLEKKTVALNIECGSHNISTSEHVKGDITIDADSVHTKDRRNVEDVSAKSLPIFDNASGNNAILLGSDNSCTGNGTKTDVVKLIKSENEMKSNSSKNKNDDTNRDLGIAKLVEGSSEKPTKNKLVNDEREDNLSCSRNKNDTGINLKNRKLGELSDKSAEKRFANDGRKDEPSCSRNRNYNTSSHLEKPERVTGLGKKSIKRKKLINDPCKKDKKEVVSTDGVRKYDTSKIDSKPKQQENCTDKFPNSDSPIKQQVRKTTRVDNLKHSSQDFTSVKNKRCEKSDVPQESEKRNITEVGTQVAESSTCNNLENNQPQATDIVGSVSLEIHSKVPEKNSTCKPKCSDERKVQIQKPETIRKKLEMWKKCRQPSKPSTQQPANSKCQVNKESVKADVSQMKFSPALTENHPVFEAFCSINRTYIEKLSANSGKPHSSLLGSPDLGGPSCVFGSGGASVSSQAGSSKSQRRFSGGGFNSREESQFSGVRVRTEMASTFLDDGGTSPNKFERLLSTGQNLQPTSLQRADKDSDIKSSRTGSPTGIKQKSVQAVPSGTRQPSRQGSTADLRHGTEYRKDSSRETSSHSFDTGSQHSTHRFLLLPYDISVDQPDPFTGREENARLVPSGNASQDMKMGIGHEHRQICIKSSLTPKDLAAWYKFSSQMTGLSDNTRYHLRRLCLPYIMHENCCMDCNLSHKIDGTYFKSLDPKEIWPITEELLHVSPKLSRSFLKNVLIWIQNTNQVQKLDPICYYILHIPDKDYVNELLNLLADVLSISGVNVGEFVSRIATKIMEGKTDQQKASEIVSNFVTGLGVFSGRFLKSTEILKQIATIKYYIYPVEFLNFLIPLVVRDPKKELLFAVYQRIVKLKEDEVQKLEQDSIRRFLWLMLKHKLVMWVSDVRKKFRHLNLTLVDEPGLRDVENEDLLPQRTGPQNNETKCLSQIGIAVRCCKNYVMTNNWRKALDLIADGQLLRYLKKPCSKFNTIKDMVQLFLERLSTSRVNMPLFFELSNEVIFYQDNLVHPCNVTQFLDKVIQMSLDCSTNQELCLQNYMKIISYDRFCLSKCSYRSLLVLAYREKHKLLEQLHFKCKLNALYPTIEDSPGVIVVYSYWILEEMVVNISEGILYFSETVDYSKKKDCSILMHIILEDPDEELFNYSATLKAVDWRFEETLKRLQLALSSMKPSLQCRTLRGHKVTLTHESILRYVKAVNKEKGLG